LSPASLISEREIVCDVPTLPSESFI
jgi:hypothetical protein